MRTAHQPTYVSRWKYVALFGGGSVLFLAQLVYPAIRFEWPVANTLLGFALGLTLPWLTLVAIFRTGQRWSKAIGLTLAIPVVLYSAVFVFGSFWFGMAIKNGRDYSFDRFAETHWNGSKIRFYRTSGGAMTAFGVAVRQERSLLPGVLLVRPIDGFYPCYSLDAVGTDTGISVSDRRSECSDLQEHTREYRLKPYLYF